MAQNVAIVKALPKGAEAIVYIGVNLGLVHLGAEDGHHHAALAAADRRRPRLQQPHQYSTETGILSTAKKKALVQGWLADRYPVFKRNFGTSAGVLETLIKVCQTRGYKPVLFELPRDTRRHRQLARARPRPGSATSARRWRRSTTIPWVSLVSAARLPNSGFYDLWHLVEPGRKVWQGLLSARTAALLEQYGYDGGGS